MRVGYGVVTALILAVSAQPALAICIIRGGVTNCVRDTKYPKYPNATMRYEADAPAADPAPNAKTIVLQPSALSENAWVLAPENDNGATVLGGTTATAFDGLDGAAAP